MALKTTEVPRPFLYADSEPTTGTVTLPFIFLAG